MTAKQRLRSLARLQRGDLPLALRTRPRAPVTVAGVCAIYRAANAVTLAELIREPIELGWPVHLHALDRIVPALDAWTEGVGPGAKFDLVDGLMRSVLPGGRRGWWIIADDDVVVVRGSLSRAVALAASFDLDLAQPAHHPRSNWNYHVTVRRPLTRARRTTFVEIGPLLMLSERAVDTSTPFEAGMGFGLEHRWATQGKLRLGVIDEVLIDHRRPTGIGYDAIEQWAEAEQRLGVSRAAHRALERRTVSAWSAFRPPPGSGRGTGR